MVVEDNALTAKFVKLALKHGGFDVIEAATARTCVHALSESKPDLILLDLMLPDMHGFELLPRIKRLPGNQTVPVIAFSAFHELLEDAKRMQLGFALYLPKPVERVALLNAIHRALEENPPGAESALQG